MRLTKVQIAGLAVAIASGVAAGDASAADLTISTSTDDPVATSSANAGPGAITITSAGAIALPTGAASDGLTAATVDSDHALTNQGAIRAEDSDNVTGVRIIGGGAQTVTNSGTISLIETYAIDDIDDDGDFDRPAGVLTGTGFAEGVNRYGVLLQGGGAYNGAIVNSGGITIEGNQSAGIWLDEVLNADLTSSGTIAVLGDNSFGVRISDGVTGDVTVNSVQMIGENSVGVSVEGAIGGGLTLTGAITATGYHSTARPIDTSDLDADDTLSGGAAVSITASVAEGVLIAGVGVEDDEDDDGDGTSEANGDTNDDVTATITSFGDSPALEISGAAGNIAIGAVTGAPSTVTGFAGQGVYNRGTLGASGVYDGVEATALRIAGDGNQVTIAGGLRNDGAIAATAVEANAYAVRIEGNVAGAGGAAFDIINRNAINAQVTSEDAGDTAYGIYLGAGAFADTLTNHGAISAQLRGEAGDAVAIRDASGALTEITNTGSIVATIVVTDDDLTDGVTPVLAPTAQAIAIDLSANTTGITLNQLAENPAFTDQDSTDNDNSGAATPRIVGDILLGSGADTINLGLGSITGDIDFGGGGGAFTIGGAGAEASFTGALLNGAGVALNLVNGAMTLSPGAVELGSASFSSDATLIIDLSSPTPTTINVAGAVTFADNAVITPLLPIATLAEGSQVFLTAGSITAGANVLGDLTGADAPWIYNVNLSLENGDTDLRASYALKTAAELGFNANQAAAYNPILAALRQDEGAATALGGLSSEREFFDAYQDMLPNFASAAAELSATAIDQGLRASSNRLAATRLRDVDHSSIWLQEIAYGVEREPESYGVEYRGSGFGFAAGIDAPLDNGLLFGLSLAFIASEVEEPGRSDGEIAASIGQVNAYLGTSLGAVNLDLVAGGGFGQMKSRRIVEIGSDYSAEANAEWNVYEGHASLQATAPMVLADWLIVTPRGALTYVVLSEDGYEESGGGAAIDLELDSATSQRLWADAMVDFATRFEFASGLQVTPKLSLGYRADVLGEEAEREARFVYGGDSFTLTDEDVGGGAPVIGLGVEAGNDFSVVSVQYEGEFGDTLERHSLNASLRFRF